MVVLVDLVSSSDDESAGADGSVPVRLALAHAAPVATAGAGVPGRPNPNVNGFSAALSCYP